jgi:hypothetical protein
VKSYSNSLWDSGSKITNKKEEMKALSIFVISALAISASVMAGPGVTNQPAVTNALMRVRVTAICSSTNTNGGLSKEFMSNRDFIEDCTSDMGLTNLMGLSLVYNRTNQALEVVSGTNSTLVCTVLSFEGGLSITNTNNTRIEGLSFIFVGTNTTSSGTISTTGRITYGSTNQITSWGLIGRFQYAVSASGTNAAEICRGTLLAGSALLRDQDRDQDDDDHDGKGEDDDDDDNGNNGNNGNNGSNGNHGRGNHGQSKNHGNH